MTSPTTLYRLYDSADDLLYIGIGGNPGRRFEQHRTEKPWWGDVARIALEHHPTRDAALKAELTAIRTENPRHNIAGRDPAAASTLPAWRHRPLSNGAYLDIEDRGDHFYVGINRDELVDSLQLRGGNWYVPCVILEATDLLNHLCIYWLWADGCKQETFSGSAGSRYRGIHVRRQYVAAASRALTASELSGDLSQIESLTATLRRTFPPNETWKKEFLDGVRTMNLVEAGTGAWQ